MEENIIICGDSAEVLKSFDDNCIDLTVTSPPYDNLRDYSGYTFDFEMITSELYRVTKPGGVVVWVVGDQTINGSKSGTGMRQALHVMDIGFLLHDEMIYQKNGPSYPAQNKYYQPIKDRKNRWFGQKWSKKRTRRTKDGSLHETAWYADEGSEYGVRFNVWKYNVGHGYSATDDYAYKHPAIFPEALARDHILSWTNPGDLVLDCFAGSGTTLKMAMVLNRRYVGIEISDEYVVLANKRLLATTPPLF